MQVTRRQLVMGLAAAAAGLAAPGAYFLSPRPLAPKAFLDGVSPNLYDAQLGRAYLSRSPATAAQLMTRLEAKLPWYGKAPFLEAALRDAMRADYASARILKINGWLLPETFIFLSALAALA